MSATIERTFHLAPRAGRRGGWRQSARPGPEVERAEPTVAGIHPLARRIAMAITCQRLIRDGAVADAASLAGTAGVTRARMTQILNFTSLAPDVQAALLKLPDDASISERDLRPIMAMLNWRRQRQAWAELEARRTPSALASAASDD